MEDVSIYYATLTVFIPFLLFMVFLLINPGEWPKLRKDDEIIDSSFGKEK